jgi:hypothetical protein
LVKSAVAATIAVVAGLFAANMLGVAIAEAPTTATPLRTISVQGTATLPIGQADNAAAATAVYREGMAGAVADGQSKAAFLASKVGATLGAVQSVAEGGGYISCSGAPESGYAEYEGEQPDFGSPPSSISVLPSAESESAPRVGAVRKPTLKHPKKRVSAKKASAAKCKLTASVALVYAIS